MKVSWTYNPEKVNEFGLDRMRFELGDCLVKQPEKTAYLTDEEIQAVLDSAVSFKRAKFELVKSLLHRFAYEVDERAGPVSWSLHQRFDAWKKLHDDLEKELQAEDAVPFGNELPEHMKRPPYFFEDMHRNNNTVWRGH